MIKLYDERDVMGLDRAGNYYCAHVEAMTAEGLHDKSDIAAELAYRDCKLAELRALCDDVFFNLEWLMRAYKGVGYNDKFMEANEIHDCLDSVDRTIQKYEIWRKDNE